MESMSEMESMSVTDWVQAGPFRASFEQNTFWIDNAEFI